MINVTEQNGLERLIYHFLESIPQESDDHKRKNNRRMQIPTTELDRLSTTT